MKRIIAIIFFTTTVQANAFGICWPSCTETTELDANTIAVSARGTGLFAFGVNEDMMAAAASETLQRGFTRFRVVNPQDYTTLTPIGNAYNGNGWIGTRREGQSTAVIQMFNAGDDGYNRALDARAMLRKYGG
jgi:hypothetical protein